MSRIFMFLILSRKLFSIAVFHIKVAKLTKIAEKFICDRKLIHKLIQKSVSNRVFVEDIFKI